jgi:hypothetical protein
VQGSHLWKQFGTYTIRVTVVDASGGNAQTGTSTTKILDAAIQGSQAGQGLANINKAWAVRITCFSDANPYSLIGDFDATIKWGDGKSSTATIKKGTAKDVYGGSCPGWDYGIFGSHTYSKRGTFKITVSIVSIGGSKATGGASVKVQ